MKYVTARHNYSISLFTRTWLSMKTSFLIIYIKHSTINSLAELKREMREKESKMEKHRYEDDIQRNVINKLNE